MDAARVRARLKPGSLRASFDATQNTRRLRSWAPSSSNLNTIIASGGAHLLRRSRDLCRNNGYAVASRAAFVAAVAGCGIKPSWLVESADLKKAGQAAWRRWTDESDADGLTDFYGQQAMAAGEMFEAGECFIRIRPRQPSDGFYVPLQLQLLPAEMLPWEKTEQLPGGRTIRCGIEFNGIGQRLAYWFYRKHPGDATDSRVDGELYTRVPASEVLHLYMPSQPGLIRGVPWLAPAMIRLRMLDDYDDAELERKRTAAMFAAFVTEVPPADGMPAEGETVDGAPLLGFEPGMIQKLMPGEDVKFAEPADVGQQYDAFQIRNLLAVSSGVGVPYATVTGDLRQVNYSSIRAGMVDFRRRVEQLQHAVMVYQLCRPIWARWLETAVLAGRLSVPRYASDRGKWHGVKWITPAWPWVDPLKDRQAEALAVANKFKARSDVVEAEGEDVEEVDARIAADMAREEALGLPPSPDQAAALAAVKVAEEPAQPDQEKVAA